MFVGAQLAIWLEGEGEMWILNAHLGMMLCLRAKLLCRQCFHIPVLLGFQEMPYSGVCLALRHVVIEERLAAIDNLLGRQSWRAYHHLLH